MKGYVELSLTSKISIEIDSWLEILANNSESEVSMTSTVDLLFSLAILLTLFFICSLSKILVLFLVNVNSEDNNESFIRFINGTSSSLLSL
ncbi:hypothetical protein AM629_18130 [Photorhabdus heterorhabditis]|uniref:Uncharacterized protein n=1 Tax=Photorhabdus heterorhabditis TaxID=880156 RepID=A0ABR5K7T3_9GAMM|nr:hypothetical protein AM629_18130 [Photorhabdus heterorhabditis]